MTPTNDGLPELTGLAGGHKPADSPNSARPIAHADQDGQTERVERSPHAGQSDQPPFAASHTPPTPPTPPSPPTPFVPLHPPIASPTGGRQAIANQSSSNPGPSTTRAAAIGQQDDDIFAKAIGSDASRKTGAKTGAKSGVAGTDRAGTDRADAALTGSALADSAIVPTDEHDVDRGLARIDPLTIRPRLSSRVMCAVFGVLLLALAVLVWWVAVWTEVGQSYDDLVLTNFNDAIPGPLAPVVRLFTMSPVVIAVSAAFALAAFVIMAIRRRWWLIGQSVALAALCYAATLLKYVLPRPFIIYTNGPVANSAPSGHTMLAATACALLLIAVAREGRALAAVVGMVVSSTVGLSVIAGKWHRPSDVIMSMLIVAGLTLIILAFTRASGMDAPGRRVSSISVQIVGTVMITAGLIACMYAGYVVWQILPGLSLSAGWAVNGAHASTVVGVLAIASLTGGLILAMRHLTAAPLSRMGLIGAPPAPPKQANRQEQQKRQRQAHQRQQTQQKQPKSRKQSKR